MNAHTKGPWTVGESETRLPIKAGSRTVAYVQMSRRDYEDAHLIAAAPDMWAVLDRIVRDYDHERELSDAIFLARAILARGAPR